MARGSGRKDNKRRRETEVRRGIIKGRGKREMGERSDGEGYKRKSEREEEERRIQGVVTGAREYERGKGKRKKDIREGDEEIYQVIVEERGRRGKNLRSRSSKEGEEERF